MQSYRTEVTITNNGTLKLEGIPFQAGEQVEVVLRNHEIGQHSNGGYPLRGKPVSYDNPTASVAEGDWGVLK